MVKNSKKVENIDSIFFKGGKTPHSLHLYSSGMDKYSIQATSLTSEASEKQVYVTLDNPNTVRKKFEWIEGNLSVIKPSELPELIPEAENLNMVIDGASISGNSSEKLQGESQEKFFDHSRREKFLSENFSESSIVCFYDLGKLNKEILKELASSHDMLMLTRNDTTMMASEEWGRADISPESIQRVIKDELRTVVLALLLQEPMHGTEIISKIHDRFGVLLSPGTIYPLLHELEEEDLLKCEYGTKTKTYCPQEGSENEIRNIIKERIKVSNFLSEFLKEPKQKEMESS